MMIGLPKVVALKYLKSAGKCHGMLLSTPITRFSPRAAIRLRGSDFFMLPRIPEPPALSVPRLTNRHSAVMLMTHLNGMSRD